jgi:hypothetical protein
LHPRPSALRSGGLQTGRARVSERYPELDWEFSVFTYPANNYLVLSSTP